MWKNFFFFSRGQRTGIILLIILISLALGTNYLLPIFFPVSTKTDQNFRQEVEAFKRSLINRDSLRQLEWEKQNKARQLAYENKYKFTNQPFATKRSSDKFAAYTLSKFDPNTIDSAGLTQLGLKPYIAANILKYRKSGGRFRTSADFEKIYGISPQKFKELAPYISIAESKQTKSETAAIKRADILVDLNSADTTLLMQVKGIGRGYAKGILRFRQSTGGFITVDQLSEIYGMRPENLERIRPYCTVNPTLIQRIKVNTATVERLKQHPYIGFFKAKAIYELRRNKGKLKDINDLKAIPELTSNDLSKIMPYLSFE